MVVRHCGLVVVALVAFLGRSSEAHAQAPHAHGKPAAHARPSGATQTPGPHDATSRHSFEEVEKWVAVFDDPARDAWQKPSEIVAALDLRPGMRVADLGAGTGYFLRYLARAVGPAGWVFAVDTEPRFVEHLRNRARREGVHNSTPVLASPDDPSLPPRSIDLLLIVDTLHHIDDRVEYAKRLQHILKPGGRIAIVDWKKRDLPVGPPLDHKLAREQVVTEMTRAGYRLTAEADVLPYQYFLIFAARAGDSSAASPAP